MISGAVWVITSDWRDCGCIILDCIDGTLIIMQFCIQLQYDNNNKIFLRN